MNRSQAGFITALALFVPSSVALTETIILKNGTVLKGSIVQMTEIDVTIDTADMGQMVIKRRAVQSINDGVVTSEAMAVPTANPSSVNINNNNNNANIQATSSVTSELPEKNPASEMPVVAGSLESTKLAGVLAFGVGQVSIENLSKGKRRMPLVHWEPLGYQFANGYSLDLVGDIMYEKSSLTSFKFLHTGIAFGVASKAPPIGQSGAAYTARLSLGVASLEAQEKWDKNSTASKRRKGSGTAQGLMLGYTYFASGGSGLNIGISALQIPMKIWTETQRYSEYSRTYNDNLNRTVSVVEAYAGLAYRF